MHILTKILAAGLLFATPLTPILAATTQAGAVATDPSGKFVDEFGTSFEFSLCGDGTDLCGVLTNLEGASATDENLAFVGKQVMQATLSAPNEWKGSLAAGGMSADATVTQTGPDTIEIQGCRAAILCQTLAYHRT